jgi:hypothetical protein
MQFVAENTQNQNNVGLFQKVMMNEQENENNYTLTDKGALTLKSSLNNLVDLFYQSTRKVDKNHIENVFVKSLNESELLTAKMVAYIRDIRGGKGERDLAKTFLVSMALMRPDIIEKNLRHYVHEYGRWDDGLPLLEIDSVKMLYLNIIKEQLEKDLIELNEKGEKANISLCAKWVPTEGKSDDKKYKFTTKLSKLMGINQADLRKKYIGPLRKHLNLIETKMMQKNYAEIDYSKVPSRCMHIHGQSMGKKKSEPNAFHRNDKERYEEYLAQLKEGKVKVNASTLYPHEIMNKYFNGSHVCHNEVDDLTEGQWKVMEEKMKALGKIGKTLCLCDVSGSMSGIPMSISISLGILISGCCEVESFKDFILTFTTTPQFHKIEGKNLLEKINNLSRAAWHGSTNFYLAFTTILDRAVKNSIPADQMPERLIVISDMQFDVAGGNTKTNFEAIDELYKKAGYKRPQLIFWNVNGSTKEVPVRHDTADTGLVSGYSPDILKAVLNGDGLTPKDIMIKALMDERYNLITV